jgi:2-polyprenyl-3-methyl-5-hydroxy-6-metoxy-1,4-benzoquinol methylase
MSERRSVIYEQEREAARRYAPAYDAAYESPFWRSERRGFAELVARLANDNRIGLADARVLDVGTGTGSTLVELRELGARRLVGIDISPDMLAIAREKLPDADLRIDAIEDVRDVERFDVLIGFSVLHHLPDLRAFFGDVARLLRPGGVFAFSDPNAAALMMRRSSSRIVWAVVSPIHALLRFRNRHELAARPTMTEPSFYSDAHRALSTEDIEAALPSALTARVSSHGIVAPTLNSALVGRRLDSRVLTIARAVDRRLPFAGDALVVTGVRVAPPAGLDTPR